MALSELLLVLFLSALVQGVVIYLAVKAAFLRGFRSALALLAGRSRQKGLVNSVRGDFHTVVRWVKTIEVVAREP
ncbi:hypothetical protein [Planosporangium mesophilum]|uniref:Uncharacterized protein n=1 Tax=Planosporangium mesophilum TaxID=689768 RepID=A0A8J3TA03_9ACTN|nr:hypothetical protein [Planosporangium mesophilum]NJC84018.1 hypothetical protein [Planosporangium mesophilum]GII22613.1 hypothetical protein Pme01_22100 [Planosporangium mesophilum]